MGNQPDFQSDKFVELINKIKHSSKYKNYPLLDDTIMDLINNEILTENNMALLEKKVKRKLHNITALYLGDPDYSLALELIKNAIKIGEPILLKDTLSQIMETHISTKERIQNLDFVYKRIFTITGKPRIILDLACGLHPLSIPWMDLPDKTSYWAYDIHYERVKFLNKYFLIMDMESNAIHQDIVINPPKLVSDITFLLKEVHRFEQRSKGTSRKLLEKLQSKYIVVSFPNRNISGKPLGDSYHRLFEKIITDKTWEITEFSTNCELFFIIRKDTK